MNSTDKLQCLLRRRPAAYARVHGSSEHPSISGIVSFYQDKGGVLLVAEVSGLPESPTSIYGFHIHEGSRCAGTQEDPFADAGGHYNPDGEKHPMHAGDLPPLFGNGGCALMAVYTDRFTVGDVIGRTVIIHASPDDFTTQPSGNSGRKIACGQILCAASMPCT